MATIEGTNGADTIFDTAGDDNITAKGGNDIVYHSFGRDRTDGGSGDDTLIINWASASQDAYLYNYTSTHGYVNTGSTFSDSTRRIDHWSFEHLDVTTGSGNDHLEATFNSWDSLDGGAGIDRWIDSFSSLTAPISVNMESVSGGGQSYADGTTVRNIEVASLTLTQGGDTFRDFGAFDDKINGYSGDDDLGTSGGRDVIDGQSGVDTLTIDWADATEDAFVNNYTSTHGYVNTGSTFSDSTRRVDHWSIEHLDVTTGSGDDHLEATFNSWDSLDGGAGIDRWIDNFSSLTAPISVNMESVSGGGQSYADGTTVRNIEVASLTLTQGGDTFRDFGAFDDKINGYSGDDDLGTSGGRDVIDGQSGVDTLTIDWADATEDAFVYNYSSTYGYVNTGSTFSDSTRRVDHWSIEHLDVTTGSGDDHLEATFNSWDSLDGGAGIDRWIDSFSSLTAPISVNMASVSGGGESYADGTTVRNIEVASLTLTQGGDTFRDFGAFDDKINGYSGDDDLGTSGGRDTIDGQNGTDTLTIDWADATDDAFVYNYSSTFGYVNTGSTFSDSTRRVDHWSIEHLDVTTGGGADRIEATFNSSDKINAGGGEDLWIDSFSNRSAAISVDMKAASSSTGQILADGTQVRNVEAANLTLGKGNDKFHDFGAHNDRISAGDGNDILGTTNGRDNFNGQGGTDTLVIDWSTASENAFFFATSSTYAYVNTNTGFSDSTRRVDFWSIEKFNVTFGSGNDSAQGSAGNDRFKGGAGGDTLSGLKGADTIKGGGGNDVLRGGDDNDKLFGNNQKDKLYGDAGSDLLNGGGGNDTLEGGAGGDTLDGGLGEDTASYASAGSAVHADLGSSGSLGDAAGDSYTGIENVTGSNFDDQLTGDGAANVLRGGSGKDVLSGKAGKDILRGQAGDDQHLGGNGADKLYGGTGNDTLNGGNGNDRLLGDAGNDKLYGGSGNDKLFGRANDDALRGQGGKDVLDGGAGNDTLHGGLHADVFVFNDGRDVILDFTDDIDTIRLNKSALGLEGMTKAQVLDLAEVVSGDVAFDFGGGNVLTVENFTDINMLFNDLELV